jgi:sn-glycerol 3-phosphate transport system ATP-binding protein
MARVLLRDVRKSYTGMQVIHGVSIDVADGEFVVIVGPSGCGKSTLLRMVAGLETISSGQIAIGERVVNELEPKDRDIDARVKRAAGILELGALLGRKPRELSGGQRQRVAMGRAIVREPAVFLFDEPLSNLDAKLRVQMRVELQALHRRLGTTSLYVTHDQIEAMTLAHRMMVMNAGRAEQIGAPLEVYAKPATTFVAGFIGSPPMNLMPARLNGREVLLGVRPEHLEPCSESEADFVAVVDLVEPLGADTLAHGTVEGTRIVVRLTGAQRVSEGRLPLRFDPAQRHYFDAASGARIESL